MSIKTNYDKIIEEIKTLKIPYDNISDNIIWIPQLCSKANANDNLICIAYHTSKNILGIEFITKDFSKRAYHRTNETFRFENENEIKFHSIISEILNYYFEEIDKTP